MGVLLSKLHYIYIYILRVYFAQIMACKYGLWFKGKFAIMEWLYGIRTENILLIIQVMILKLLYSLGV